MAQEAAWQGWGLARALPLLGSEGGTPPCHRGKRTSYVNVNKLTMQGDTGSSPAQIVGTGPIAPAKPCPV